VDFITQEEAKKLINTWLDQGMLEGQIRTNLTEHGFIDTVITKMLSDTKNSRYNIGVSRPTVPSGFYAPQSVKPDFRPASNPTVVPPAKVDSPAQSGLVAAMFSGKYNLLIGGMLLVLAILNAITPSYSFISRYLPVISNIKSKTENIVKEIFPPDLEIKVTNGVLSTNVTEPYYLNIPKKTLDLISPQLGSISQSSNDIRLLTIDTKGKAEEFDKYQTQFLLTQNNLIYYNKSKITIQPLRNIQNLTVNQSFILTKISEGKGLINLGTTFFYISPILITLSLLVGYTFQALFLNFAIWIFTRVVNPSLKYSSTYPLVLFVLLCFTFVVFVTSYIPYINAFNFSSISNFVVIGIAFSIIRQHRPFTT
jgi:hypothetical protein